MSPDELARAGTALYGPRWQSDLARALRLSESHGNRRVREWLSGERSIPPGLRADLVRLLRAKAAEAAALADELAA